MVEWTGHIGGVGPAASLSKRALDILGATLVLLFFAPTLLVMLAAIRLSRGGPIFTREETAGLNGKPFGRWRLYRPQGDQGVLDALAWRAGLGDLPAMLNVLAGDMSLIGPRPRALERWARAHQARADHERRLSARPGVIWPSAEDGQTALGAELDYIAGWTLGRDLKVAGAFAVHGLLHEKQEVG